MRVTHFVLPGLALVACSQAPPPGAEPKAEASVAVVVGDPRAPAAPSARAAGPEPGTQQDNLPFEATDERVASVAARTWIYTDTGSKRTRYGYLRAGAVVPRRSPAIKNDGCQGGWYRINPRGFVCVGLGATPELGHPVVIAADVRPRRGEGLPYLYALAKDPGPHFYFRLPRVKEMLEVEGPGYAGRVAEWRALMQNPELASLLGEIGPPPPFVPRPEQAAIEKPYGTEKGLHRSATAGRSSAEAGFALLRAFDWEGRTFGLTTEHDVIPLDRTTLVRPSTFHGVELGEGEDLPVAIVTKRWALRYRGKENGQLEPMGTFAFREGIKLTGRTVRYEGVSFWEGQGGVFVPSSSALIVDKRTSYPSVAEGGRKWIDISIKHQSLVAYEGQKAVYVTLVSTGLGGLSDPEKTPATARGTFMIHTKHVSATMDGDDDVSDSFSLRDVPFVQYFHKGYALHGAYWHDDFGKERSHGCVNLAPIDAAWLFEWTDPSVPEGWHGVINKERGTAIIIRV